MLATLDGLKNLVEQFEYCTVEVDDGCKNRKDFDVIKFDNNALYLGYSKSDPEHSEFFLFPDIANIDISYTYVSPIGSDFELFNVHIYRNNDILVPLYLHGYHIKNPVLIRQLCRMLLFDEHINNTSRPRNKYRIISENL